MIRSPLALMVSSILLASTLSITACGNSGPDVGQVRDNTGGSDDNSGGDNSGGDSTRVALQMVEGQVFASGNGTLEGVNVSLNAVTADNEEVLSLTATTDEYGAFQMEIPSSAEQDIKRIYATFEKDGFSSSDTFVDVGTAAVAQLNATLAIAYTASISRADLENLAVAADGVPSLQISLMASSNGLKRVVVGEVSPADGEVADVAVNIPVNNIDPDAEVINVSISTFDSGNEEDLESFPGDFTAQGEVNQGTTGADLDRDDTNGETGDLISTTFFDINLTDQDGNALSSNTSDATAAASGTTSIRRYASSSVYKRIYADVDPSVEGIQFPFFVKRSGYYSSWQYVGNGTIVDASGRAIGPNHPTIPVTIGADGSVDLTTVSGNPTLYFDIVINSWSEWVRYINVDYYTANLSRAQQPVSMCFDGTVQYGGGSAYNGYMYMYTPDYGYVYVPVSNGKFSFERTISPINGSPLDKAVWENGYNYLGGRNMRNPQTYTYTYYYWYWTGGYWGYWTYMPRTYTFTYYPWEYSYAGTMFANQSQLVDKANGCNEINFVFTNPANCKVSGHVYDLDGVTPLSGEVVTLRAGASRINATTDANGYYSSAAWCDATYDVTAVSKTASFTLSTGNSPYTQNFVDDNRPPVFGLFKEVRKKLYTSQSTFIKWYSSDPEGDDVDVTLGQCVSEDAACSVERSNSDNRATLTFAQAGTYTITATASDGHNDVTRTMSFDVVDADVNLPPSISGFVVNGKFVGAGGLVTAVEGSELVVAARATDANGDALTYEWSDIDGAAAGCGTSSDCILDLASTGEYTFAVTVTDTRSGTDSLSSRAAFTLNVAEDAAPVVNISLSASYFSAQSNVNIEPIRATLTARDDYTAVGDLEISWKLFDSNNQDISSRISSYFFNDFNMSIPPGAFGTGTYRLVATVTDTAPDGGVGLSGTASATFRVVSDMPPTIEISAPSATLYGTSTGGSSSSLTLTATYGDAEGVRSFAWNVPSGLSTTRNGDQLVIAGSSLKPGTYNVGATVTDTSGTAVQANRVITVETDQPPVIADLTVTPASQLTDGTGFSVEAVSVTVSASDDLGTATVKSWSVSPSVVFTSTGNRMDIAAGAATAGTYQITVEVEDNRGQTSTRSASFDVIDRPGNVEVIIE